MIGTIIILIIMALITNGLSYLLCNNVSFLRMYIMWQGIKKEYGTVIKEKGLTIKPYDISYEWEKTPYGDFVIEFRLLDQVGRTNTRYSIAVDKNGKFIDGDLRDNYDFLINIGLKDRPEKPHRRGFY